MAYLLLIDDDDFLIPEQVRRAMPSASYRVEIAATGGDGLGNIIPNRSTGRDSPRLATPRPSRPETSTSRSAGSTHIPVIFITMAKNADAAIEAMRQGALRLPISNRSTRTSYGGWSARRSKWPGECGRTRR